MLRKAIAGLSVALSLFTGTAVLAPASAQAAGIWVYVQSWLATNPTEAKAAALACHLTARNRYPGHNHQCRGDVPNYVQLWVEY